MNNNIYKYGMFLSVGIILILLALSRGKDETIDLWKGKYEAEVQTSKTLSNKLQQAIQEQQAVQVTQEQLKQVSAQVFQLQDRLERQIKEVKAFVKVRQIVKVPTTVYIPYDSSGSDPVVVNMDSAIFPPKKFQLKSDYYSISGRVLFSGVNIDSMEMINDIAIRIADKKVGLFKRPQIVVQAINSNPYVTTQSMQSLTYKPKNSAWNQWVKPLICVGVGFLGGAAFSNATQ